jgi:ABC-type Fe3+-siderophore transport system permease subunit
MTDQPDSKKWSAKKLIALAIGFAIGIFWSLPTWAQVDLGMTYAESLGLPINDIREIIARLIRVLIGLMGFLLLLIILWSGFLYMTHGGDEEKREEAVNGIKNAVVGLVIMMISFSAVRFIVNAIGEATNVF